VSDAPKHFEPAKPQFNSAKRRKPEDTADGCRALEQADRLRALATVNGRLRWTLESSADSWGARAILLERLEASLKQKAAASFEGSGRGNG
jgi:hypothetical protein